MMENKRSKELLKRARAITPGGVHSPVRAFKSVGLEPFVVDYGEGAYLIDVDGNRYVDYINSWGPLVLGHAHPAVVEAIAQQAQRGTSYGASSELEVRLAEQIIKLMPNLEMIRFVNSGTEACMSALRLARGFTKRKKIIKFVGCYHGHSDQLLVKAGSGVLTLGLPASAGVPESVACDTLSAQFNDLDSVEEIFKKYPDEVAGLIVEPIVGNCGLILPGPGFLKGLRELCTRYGALLIFDEVMTGFRVDLHGAQALYDTQPDLTTLGKVIGGGLPVGAYGGRREVMKFIAPEGPVYQAGTLSGNPLAMASGIATLAEWCKPGVFEQIKTDTQKITTRFRELAEQNNIALCADCAGTMFGFFFHEGPVLDYETANQADVERFKKFFALCLERGVYFAPSQFEAGFVSAAHHGEPLKQTLAVLEEVFSLL